MAAYYNELDKFAAAWLRELIKAKLIADGEVDERSITDVRPDELRGFSQCHFFAGIGGWSYALRLAGWPDDREVWTGSCPCQPFSVAGEGKGTDDPRHLWPSWFRLIRECRPAIVLGEQTASVDGLYWLDLVYAGLEAEDYAVGAVDISGACLGSPDIRPRLWFVADANGTEFSRFPHARAEPLHGEMRGDLSRLADGYGAGLAQRGGDRVIQREAVGKSEGQATECCRDASRLDDSGRAERRTTAEGRNDEQQRSDAGRKEATGRQRFPGALGGFWADAEWVYCRPEPRYPEGCWRPIEPGSFPLAARIPARIRRLRGYGNSIKPQVAQVFIEAYCDARGF